MTAHKKVRQPRLEGEQHPVAEAEASDMPEATTDLDDAPTESSLVDAKFKTRVAELLERHKPILDRLGDL